MFICVNLRFVRIFIYIFEDGGIRKTQTDGGRANEEATAGADDVESSDLFQCRFSTQCNTRQRAVTK